MIRITVDFRLYDTSESHRLPGGRASFTLSDLLQDVVRLPAFSSMKPSRAASIAERRATNGACDQ